MLNVEQVADELRVSRDTVYRLIRTGTIPARRMPGTKGYWIEPESLAAYSAGHREPGSRAVLTVAETCRRLGCAPETVRRLIATGQLPGYRLGGPRGHLRVPEAGLEQYIAEHTVAGVAGA